MWQLGDKRGVSEIIAVLLIILITLATVTILWAAVGPLVSHQLEKGSSCRVATSQLSLVNKGYTCGVVIGNSPNPNSENSSFQIKRGSEEFALVGIQLIIEAYGRTQTFLDTDATGGSIPDPNQVQVLTLETGWNTPHPTDTVFFPATFSIAPIILVGNQEVTCDIASTVKDVFVCGLDP